MTLPEATRVVAEAPAAEARPNPRVRRPARFAKRAFDLALASLSLVLLSPLFLVVAIAIKLGSPGPVFYRQLRIGYGVRPFRIYKFRTMALDADARKAELAHLNVHSQNGGNGRMFKVIDDPRVTPVGRVLRKYFLDELPQLINVVRGEMSLVGPRPLIPEEDCETPDWARRRLSVRPGMTGTWQVQGNSRVPFEEMIELDCEYVEQWTLRSDLGLIFRTIPLVVHGDGESR